MTTAHTPGPWSVGPHPGNGAGTGWRMVLADTPEFGPLYIAEALADDARLIAAAPDLLAALREFLELSELAGDDDHQAYAPTMAKARAAITKATTT